jgi:hypothetical protein
VNVPVFPARPRAGFGVVDNPVLVLAKGFHERTVADAPDLPVFLKTGCKIIHGSAE